MEYKDILFEKYRKTHVAYLDTTGKEDFYKLYYKKYYANIFKHVKNNANFLEIGCNCGYAMRVIKNNNISWKMTGIDMSPDDLAFAKSYFGEGDFIYADAFDFLKSKDKVYDIIYSRAVFEHIDKNRILELYELCKNALKNDGILVIEVPNMDWIYATHERYMDFTHEVGLTSESLSQLHRSIFGNSKIFFSDNNNRYFSLKMKIARPILGTLLQWSEPALTKEKLFSKCMIAVSSKNDDDC